MARDQTPWSDNDEAALARMVGEGMTDRQIALEMGRPFSSVTQKRQRMDLPAGTLVRKGIRESRNEAAEAIDPMNALPVRPVEVVLPDLPAPVDIPGKEYTSIHYSDVHFPYQSDATLSILYQIVRDTQPDAIVDHGDLLDCYAISRYEKDPRNRISLQDEIDMAARHLGILAALAPNARKKLLMGNHEDRLRRLLWSMAERQEAHQVLSLKKIEATLQWPVLLDLASMGWEWHEKRVIFANRMVLKHGSVVRKHSAYTAKGEYEKYGRCGMSGHTHRRGVYEHRDHNGTHAWWELGCCCELDPGYMDDPDWANGFAVATWSADRKSFGVEEVRVHKGSAWFRGRLYRADEPSSEGGPKPVASLRAAA